MLPQACCLYILNGRVLSLADLSAALKARLVCAGFLMYVAAACTATFLLVFLVAPAHGTSNICVYVAICSVVGSLSVVSCKVRSS